MLAEHDEAALYSLVCRRVGTVLPAAELASVTLRRRRGRLETPAATDPVAEQADHLQYSLGEGPCMEAALEGAWYVSHDVGADPRWPSWGPRAAALGIRSLISVRLPADTLHERHEPLGALNLYARRAGALGPDELRIARVYAQHAGNALATARQLTGLEHAISARHLVGAAQGVLRQRYDLDLETAFELLTRLSNERNTKLRDLAAQVVAERALPDEVAEAAADHAAERPRVGPA